MEGTARKISSDVAESFRPLVVKAQPSDTKFLSFLQWSESNSPHVMLPWEPYGEHEIAVLWVLVVRAYICSQPL